ncbi:MAG: glycosyltransferase [Burkholderiaceae bacterium]
MKRILIYTCDSLDTGDLDSIRSLALCLLQVPGQLELRIVSDAPLHRRARDNPGTSTVTLPKFSALRKGRSPEDPQRPSLGTLLNTRAQIIARAIAEFNPDLILVDGLPFGQYDELARIIATPWPVQIGPQWVLLLRDMIGCPQHTTQLWRERGYFEAIARNYSKVLVCGDKDVFDLEREYAMPAQAAAKLEYCGYVIPEPGRSPEGRLRRALGVPDKGALVLVTPGPGPDGESLIADVVRGLRSLPPETRPRCHIVCGAEMRESERLAAVCAIHSMPQVSLQHDSRDTMSLMAAADVVVTHGGYRKMCEVLSLRRRAVVVPGAAAAPEQAARAQRLAELGLVRLVAPQDCGPLALIDAISAELAAAASQQLTRWRPTSDAIEFVASTVHGLLDLEPECVSDAFAQGEQRQIRRGAAMPRPLPLRDLGRDPQVARAAH